MNTNVNYKALEWKVLGDGVTGRQWNDQREGDCQGHWPASVLTDFISLQVGPLDPGAVSLDSDNRIASVS